ncbi:hypothetical protein LshimejAT787_0806180 [Lyophyllum shimeji]|uniref:Uncharacterized protein n=1 Tax=Lyophyllum shimeji TaxID=47721 RepID=A0A9P3PQE2_LYOSH|nr:hypothetical protein LshimejAT787_0806180 [Lyophyllum shimeji]
MAIDQSQHAPTPAGTSGTHNAPVVAMIADVPSLDAAATPAQVTAPSAALPNGTEHAPPASPLVPTPSSARRLTRQTTASFDAARQRSSTDELIDSLADKPGPQPPTTPPSPRKGKGKEQPVAGPSNAQTSPAKPETASAAVKRLDSNMSAIAARVEGNHSDTQDQLASLRAYIVAMANDVNTITNPASNDSAAQHGLVTELIAANNRAVPVLDELRSQVPRIFDALRASDMRILALESAIQDLTASINSAPSHTTHTSSTDTHTTGSPNILVPAAKRNRTDDTNASTLILQPGIPQGAPLGPPAAYPTTPTQASGAAAQAPAPTHAPVPIAAPAIPHAPVPIAIPHAPNPYVPNPYGSGGAPNAEVRIGAVVWGKDITGQFKALLSLMPHGQSITRNVRARRVPGQQNYLAVTFPNALDAAAFVQAWAAGPAPGYQGVTAVLGN